MKTYVISLERLAERRRRTEDALQAIGLDYAIFPAIDGDKGEHLAYAEYDEGKCLRHFGAPLRPGEIGCYASHRTLWKQCLAEGEPICVIEDDAEILPGFAEAHALAGERIVARRFIRLSGLVPRDYNVLEEIDGTHRLVRFLRGPQGTQCYCLSPEGAAALLRYSANWVDPVDLYVDRFWVHGVDSLAILPFAIDHDEKDTTIGGRWRKRSGRAKIHREIRRVGDNLARRLYNLRHRPVTMHPFLRPFGRVPWP